MNKRQTSEVELQGGQITDSPAHKEPASVTDGQEGTRRLEEHTPEEDFCSVFGST